MVATNKDDQTHSTRTDRLEEQVDTGISEDIHHLVASFVNCESSSNRRRPCLVQFEGLTVCGAGIGAMPAPTVPSALIDFSDRLNPMRYLLTEPRPSRTLIHPMNGSIDGGEILLVIGKPGSGCTTFLKTMANMREEYAEVGGKCLYNGLNPAEAKALYQGEFAFSGEDDIHFHSLSVKTTLRFALNARLSSSTPGRSHILEEQLKILLQLFDMEHVSNVAVGNDYIRGISGGQRHRVTLAEALCAKPSILSLDNPTRGLDSTTALRVMQLLREYTTQSQSCTAVSLYQSSDAIASYCDKALVLNEGRVCYLGPTSDSRQYFEDLGFECPPQASLTDFLTSMSGSPGSRRLKPGLCGRPVPVTSEDFEQRFRESKYFVPVGMIEVPNVTSARQHSPSVFKLPLYWQTYECMIRHYQIHLTDRSAWIAEAFGTIAQALVLGTLFWNQEAVTQGLYTRSSALFFCALIMVLQATAEFGNTFAQRPILLKQRALCFYRPAAYALGQILADIPWKAIFVLYSVPIYWLVNFKRDAGSFFTWYLSLYVSLMAMGVMFRTIAVFTTTATRAVLPVGILMNSFIIFTGFYINPPGMKIWLGWLRYLNPMYYTFESVMVNEAASRGFQCGSMDIVPQGTNFQDTAYQTCAVQSSIPGELTIKGQRYLEAVYNFYQRNLWRNIGINAAFFLFFALTVAIGMERFKTPAGRLATVYYSGAVDLGRQSRRAGVPSDEEKAQTTSSGSNEVGLVDSHSQQTRDQAIARSQRRFSWKNICLDIELDGQTNRLLHNISGWLEPGSMTALMGVSGAGKTTLLNTLSQRLSLGIVSGNLYLNNKPLPPSMKRQTGFVQQQDVHLSTSTVREALQFTAALRQSHFISQEEKYEYVETVISLLDMGDIAEAIIGEPGAGLNLEQRKRVSIGVELAAKPDILLFLDEPTSGLDGDSAFSIVRLLRKLADSGQTILCTIHQPSFEVISQFDSLLLLVAGGKTAYFGSLGPRCHSVTEYFGRHGRSCHDTENPADYILALAADSSVDWATVWKDSAECKSADNHLTKMLEHVDHAGDALDDSDPKDGQDHIVFAAPPIMQLRFVLGRAFVNYWRDPDYVLGKLQLNCIMGLINGLNFLQMSNTLTESRNHIFSIFIGIITGPVLTLQIEPRFIALRDQFLAREKDAGIYHWSIFVLSASIVEIPFTLVGGLLYWLLWYYTAGFPQSSGTAAYALLMYELYQIFVASVAQLIASLFPTVNGAQLATGFVWLMVNTFNGPLSPPPLTPTGWRWFYNVSPLFYFLDGFASNIMHNMDIVCSKDEISVFAAPDGQTCGEYAAAFFDSSSARGYLIDDTALRECEYCPYVDGDEYIQQYSFNFENRGRNVGIFIGFIMFNYAIAALMTYSLFVIRWKRLKKLFERVYKRAVGSEESVAN